MFPSWDPVDILNFVEYINYMEVRIAEPSTSLSYPHWKVVLSGDRAEVAEFPCEGVNSANVVYHEDLIRLLCESQPGLALDDEFTAGWLTARDGEAVLYLHLVAHELDRLDASAVGRALGGWCASNSIRTLTIADWSGRTDADNWDPPWTGDGDFAYTLPRLLGLHNLSGASFARLLGVSTQYVWMLMNAERTPTDERLAQIADIFGIDPGRLSHAPFDDLLRTELADPGRYRKADARIASLERVRPAH